LSKKRSTTIFPLTGLKEYLIINCLGFSALLDKISSISLSSSFLEIPRKPNPSKYGAGRDYSGSVYPNRTIPFLGELLAISIAADIILFPTPFFW